MKKRITALVVTWNSSSLIPELAETLQAIEPLCNVVCSDNSSSDSTVELLRDTVPGVEVIRNPVNGGFGYGNNRGIDICRTEYLLLLNSDASISPESLEILLRTLEKDTSAAAVQPLIRLWGWPLVTLSAGAAMDEYGHGYDLDFMHFQPFPDRGLSEIPLVTAALSLFRTDILRKAGGFDEKMFMYFEDIDLCLRLRNMGYRFLIDPLSHGEHRMGASSSRRLAERWELQSSAYLTRKYLSGKSCKLPSYWKKAEFRTRLLHSFKGRPWLWRAAALHRAKAMDVEAVRLSNEFLTTLLSPRPMRMPNPRSFGFSGVLFPGSNVYAGPGWDSMRTDSCGFGCIEVPCDEGLLSLNLRSCNIPGSVSLWSEGGCMSRIFLSSSSPSGMSCKIDQGVRKLYLVSDRRDQIIELQNVTYTES